MASFSEVGGEAALYAEQTPEGYLAAMLRLLEEPALCEDMIARGHEHARQFTWRRCAEQTTAVYRRVLEGA